MATATDPVHHTIQNAGVGVRVGAGVPVTRWARLRHRSPRAPDALRCGCPLDVESDRQVVAGAGCQVTERLADIDDRLDQTRKAAHLRLVETAGVTCCRRGEVASIGPLDRALPRRQHDTVRLVLGVSPLSGRPSIQVPMSQRAPMVAGTPSKGEQPCGWFCDPTTESNHTTISSSVRAEEPWML